MKLVTNELKLANHEMKLVIHESKLVTHKSKLATHELKLDCPTHDTGDLNEWIHSDALFRGTVNC